MSYYTIIKAKRRREQEKKRVLLLSMMITVFVLVCTMGMRASANSLKNDDYKYFKVVTVEVGDTLHTIANAYYDEDHYNSYKDFVNEIMFSNHLLDPNDLVAGQNLVIPYYSPEFRM